MDRIEAFDDTSLLDDAADISDRPEEAGDHRSSVAKTSQWLSPARSRKPAARATPALIPINARELVEWTYAVQLAHRVYEQSLGGRGGCQTGIVIDRLIEYARLGCEVDVSSNAVAVWGKTRCHEDALAVHEAVEWLLPRHRDLLIEHGRHRNAPDWRPKIFPLRCVAVAGNRGNPKGIYLNSGNKQVGCEIAYEGDWPSPEFAAQAKRAAETHKRAWEDPENWPSVRTRRRTQPTVAQHNWADEPFRRCADEVIASARRAYCEWYEALWSLWSALDASGSRGIRHYRISDLGAAYEPWRS